MTTISNIAKAAGVSDMTVSRVLNGKAEYRRPTFAKRADDIRRIAKEMGYRPNTFARGVRTGKFRAIGLLMGTDPVRSAVPLPLLNGIYRALRERDLNLNMALLPDQALTDPGQTPLLLQEQMADGLLVYYTDHIPTGMSQAIDQSGVPAIWLNVRGTSNCVFPDDHGAGRLAAEHLVRLGHTRIAFADLSHSPSDPAIHYSAHDRYAGYAEAMDEAGLTPVRLWSEESIDSTQRVNVARRWLEGDDRPTAVMTGSYTNAVPLVIAATQLGLSIPRDLSLISFEPRPIEFVGAQIATMLIPQQEVGLRAVERLEQALANPGQAAEPLAVSYTFEPGETCVPPA